jgi:2Fe-2S ferredoxin
MRINVIDQTGRNTSLEALEGWRLMEIIRDWGLPINAECGGAAACATCHVYVDPAWRDRLPEPTGDELDQLDTVPALAETSRLSCQLLMSAALDGITVTLAPGSEPQEERRRAA